MLFDLARAAAEKAAQEKKQLAAMLAADMPEQRVGSVKRSNTIA